MAHAFAEQLFGSLKDVKKWFVAKGRFLLVWYSQNVRKMGEENMYLAIKHTLTETSFSIFERVFFLQKKSHFLVVYEVMLH